MRYFSRRAGGAWLLALGLALWVKGGEKAAGAEELRCVAFYSRVNGVNSTIYYVTQSISDNLGENDAISLSVYCLPSDLYESLDYKVKTAAALDMDVMIVSDLPKEMDEDMLKELQEEDIFVLVVDGQPSDYALSACIGADNRDAGAQAARLIAGQEGERQAGIIATSFRSSEISASRRERQAGFVQEAEKYTNLQVQPECICTSDTLDAMETVRTYLTDNSEINVLYCLDSASGVIASKILTEQERTEEVYVLCFDQTEQVRQEMQQGGIDAVIVQDTGQIGKECLAFLQRMAGETDREALGQEKTAVPCRMITADLAKEDAGE